MVGPFYVLRVEHRCKRQLFFDNLSICLFVSRIVYFSELRIRCIESSDVLPVLNYEATIHLMVYVSKSSIDPPHYDHQA